MKKTKPKISPKTKSQKHAARPAPSLLNRVQRCIAEKVKPMLEMHGGDIELVELTKNKTLRVRLHGACYGCPMAAMTLQYGVQDIITSEFPKEKIRIQLAA